MMNANAPIDSLRSSRPLAGLIVALLSLLLNAGAMAQMPGVGRECTLCHLEWSPGFAKPKAALLVDQPARSTAADSRTCLGCHDGSVADDRCEVWFKPGHKDGTIPSASIKVPAELPLENGKITCRTCHTAHATGVSESISDTIFLRMKNDKGQLCNACHQQQTGGPKSGTHPLTKMPMELPKTLAQVGAHAGPDNKEVVCQSCHVAHGGRDKNLLLRGTEGNKLCLSCHEQIKQLLWKPGSHEHSMNLIVKDPAQIKAVADMGTTLGKDNELLCFSCHKVHHGAPGEAMLADTLADSAMCIRCHPNNASMIGSTHDLRKSAPNEKNARNQTASESGLCGACHTFHSFTRKRTPVDGDPQGFCTTCHSEGQVAAKHSGLPLSHPGEVNQSRLPKNTSLTLYPSKDDPSRKALACSTCHDPHDTKHPSYLRKSSEQLCSDCHGEKVQSLVGSHDFSGSKLRNAQDRPGTEAGKCGFCHAVHNAPGPVMMVATKQTPKSADQTCTQCHQKDGVASKTPAAKFNHPTATARPTTQPVLPLFDERAHMSDKGSLSCATCHDPHLGGEAKKAMLRTAKSGSLCTDCHSDHQLVAGGPHDPAASSKPWPVKPNEKGDLCMNCHVPHGNDPAKETWTVALAPDAQGTDRACLACHAEHRWVAQEKDVELGATVHPSLVPAALLSKMPKNLPLIAGKDAKVANTLACRTCHNPHNGKSNPQMLRENNGKSGNSGSTPVQLCISCHPSQRTVQTSMHAPELMDPEHGNQNSCKPCHSTHAVQGGQKSLIWAAGADASGTNATEQRCLSCHGPSGSAARLTTWKHPATASGKLAPAATQATGQRPTTLPAMIDITCTTCHITHGDVPDPKLLARATPAEIRTGWKLMLRTNIDQKTCSPCHGIDAPRMFLYFHKPGLREAARKMLRQ